MTIATVEPAAAPEKKKPGRKTNVERLEIQAEKERLERHIEIESKRAKRIQPDTRWSLIVALTIAAIGLATSFTI